MASNTTDQLRVLNYTDAEWQRHLIEMGQGAVVQSIRTVRGTQHAPLKVSR